ncbi:MAG: nucleotide exchange factor GrpE [Solirubrobacteraceae bacterium]
MSTGGFPGTPPAGGVPEGETAPETAPRAPAPDSPLADPGDGRQRSETVDGATRTSPATAAGAAAAYAAAAAASTASAGAAAAQERAAEPGSGRLRDAATGDPAADGQADEEVVTPSSVEQPADDQQVVSDLDELAARAERADEYLVLAQRVRADFDNYRKRANREAAAAQERGVARLAKELLPAIDNLDRALQAAEALAGSDEASEQATESQLVSGIKLVHADVLAALARVGIEQFSPTGEPFDPTLHEAVAQAPVQGAASGMVVEVYQSGYRLGESILRPARVLVAA